MSHFEVGLILWAGNDPGAHGDHLHVEPPTPAMGYTDGAGRQPIDRDGRYINPGMSPGVRAIYDALGERFGRGGYFLASDGSRRTDLDWYHMGGYNPRPIGGPAVATVAQARALNPRRRWSRHSAWDAIDIGPLYGVAAQRSMFDYLTGRETHMEYEQIAGYKFYDVDKWPQWADAAIRANIVAGVIRGKEIDRDDPTKRVFDPNAPLTRAEAAALLQRIDAV